MRKKSQVPHSRFANLQPIQICSPSFFPNYNSNKRIEKSLHCLVFKMNEDEKWLCIFQEQGLVFFQVAPKTVELSNFENEDNLHFFQALKQSTKPTPSLLPTPFC